MKKWLVSVMALTLAIGLTACGDSDNNSASDKAVKTESANATDLTITAKNFEFDQTEYRVKKGEPINFLLKNEEGVHGIKIEDLGITLEGDKPEQYTINEAGTYEFHCNVICGIGHNKMKATLIVE